MEIKFSSTPFILIESQTYRCHQGKDLMSQERFISMKQKKKRKFYLNILMSNHENFHSQLKK